MLLVFGKKKRDNDGMTSVSPWFGASSLFTVLLFLILGALVPFYLTGGSGTSTVQTQASGTCDGLHNYSPNAIQLAQAFYAQCQANVSANGGACNFNTPLVDTRPQLKITLDGRCPFAEENCYMFKPTDNFWKDFWCKNDNDSSCDMFNKALTIEHPDAAPSDYGLNSDGNILKSHRVTCAPVNVKKFRVPDGNRDGNRNATVFWVGYSQGKYNTSETYASVGETRKYFLDLLDPQRPFKLKSAKVFDLVIYPNVADHVVGSVVYENFHPGLKRDDGDTFIVMLKFSVSIGISPLYAKGKELLLDLRLDSLYGVGGSSTISLACFEQYRLCLEGNCTEWSGAANAIDGMSQILLKKTQPDLIPQILRPQALLLESSSLQQFLGNHFRSHVMVREFFPRSDTLQAKQWHLEVQAWFELAFLTTKSSFFTSATEDNSGIIDRRHNHFGNTSWICDKVLFLDKNYTNVDFIGMMATVSGLLLILLLSYMGRVITRVKQGLGICVNLLKVLKVISQRIWLGFLPRVELVYTRIHGAYLSAIHNSLIGILYSAFRFFIGLSWGPASLVLAPRSRVIHNDAYILDEERPSASMPLEHLG